MRERARPLRRYVVFEAARRLGWPSPIGFVVYLGGIGAVCWARVTGRMTGLDAADLVLELALLGILFVYRFDADADRQSGLAEYLTPGFLSRGELLAGKVAGTVVALAASGLAAAAAAAVALRGDVALALWLIATPLLFALALSPLVLVLEFVLATRLPALALAALALVALFLGAGWPERQALLERLAGTGALRRGELASLGPLAARAAAGLLLALPLVAAALAGPLTSVESGRRGVRDRRDRERSATRG